MSNIIHTTIGIYPNGDYKVNGVREEELEEHIIYNKNLRPGRALMVNGEIIYSGYNSGEQNNEILLNKLKLIKKDSFSTSYQ